MKKPVLCLDFDGVIHSYTSGWRGPRTIPDPPVEGAIEFLLRAVQDWDVAVHSSRASYWGGRSAMRAWLRRHADGAYYDSPAGPGLERVRFTCTKPSAFVTLDDRALTFTGTWPCLETLRKFRPWNKAAR